MASWCIQPSGNWTQLANGRSAGSTVFAADSRPRDRSSSGEVWTTNHEANERAPEPRPEPRLDAPDRGPDARELLTRVLAAEARSRRFGRAALLGNLVVLLAVAGALVISIRNASPRRYVRAATMLSTTLVDESTLARDVRAVVRTHATAINGQVGPQWPTLAQRTLGASDTMERAVARHIRKRVDETFEEDRDAIRSRVRDELASALPAPALTRARLDMLIDEYRRQVRDTLAEASKHHARRSRVALETLVRELARWGSTHPARLPTQSPGRDLTALGGRFIGQHDGLASADWANEVTR